jgi:hypothetical protein
MMQARAMLMKMTSPFMKPVLVVDESCTKIMWGVHQEIIPYENIDLALSKTNDQGTPLLIFYLLIHLLIQISTSQELTIFHAFDG